MFFSILYAWLTKQRRRFCVSCLFKATQDNSEGCDSGKDTSPFVTNLLARTIIIRDSVPLIHNSGRHISIRNRQIYSKGNPGPGCRDRRQILSRCYQGFLQPKSKVKKGLWSLELTTARGWSMIDQDCPGTFLGWPSVARKGESCHFFLISSPERRLIVKMPHCRRCALMRLSISGVPKKTSHFFTPNISSMEQQNSLRFLRYI